MNYRAFSDYEKGYSHVKADMNCEDYAISVSSEASGWTGKPYWIAAACDGHSDKKCFRSAQGARFGCESAKETLERFFQQYFTQSDDERNILDAPQAYIFRLKRSLLCNWRQKVARDLENDKLKDSELEGLDEKIRSYYRNNKLVENIYGATFLAVGVCEEFFIAMQIGDGVALAVYEDGICEKPLPSDAKSETGSPASLCDNDLLSRENAFRCEVHRRIPIAAVVSSDGIEDSLNAIALRERMREILNGLFQNEESGASQLNERQAELLKKNVLFYAEQGHGAEDDCSLAGFYRLDTDGIPELKLPPEEVRALQTQLTQEYSAVMRDYEERERNMKETVRDYKTQLSQASNEYRQKKNQLKTLQSGLQEKEKILENIQANLKRKQADFESRLSQLQKYVVAPVPTPQPDVQSVTPPTPQPDVQSVTTTAPQPEAQSVTPPTPQPDAQSVTPPMPQPDAQSVTPPTPQPDAQSVAPPVQNPPPVMVTMLPPSYRCNMLYNSLLLSTTPEMLEQCRESIDSAYQSQTIGIKEYQWLMGAYNSYNKAMRERAALQTTENIPTESNSSNFDAPGHGESGQVVGDAGNGSSDENQSLQEQAQRLKSKNLNDHDITPMTYQSLR